MPDFLPASDDALAAWIGTLLTYLCDHQAELPVDAPELADATARLAAATAARAEQRAAAATLHSLTQTANARQAEVVAVVRRLAARLRAAPAVTAAQLAGMGLRPADTTLTPAAEPATVPLARVDAGQRLRHTLHIADAATPTRRARPAGTRGCEVWMKLGGEPPAGKADLAYVDTATRTPFLVEFAGEDAGQTAHYMLRWVGTRGQKGPWSETVSATVGG